MLRQRRERHLLPLVRPGHRRVGRAAQPEDARPSADPPVRDTCTELSITRARAVESHTTVYSTRTLHASSMHARWVFTIGTKSGGEG